MPALLIDGTAIAARTRAEVAVRTAALRALGKPVHLVALLIGGTPAGELYARRQGEACGAVGIGYELLCMPDDVSQRAIKSEIRRLNKDPSVTGIMMHLPLPAHLDAARLQYEIDVVKDVEGVNPANIGYVVYGHTLIAPCTALSALELIRSTGARWRQLNCRQAHRPSIGRADGNGHALPHRHQGFEKPHTPRGGPRGGGRKTKIDRRGPRQGRRYRD